MVHGDDTEKIVHCSCAKKHQCGTICLIGKCFWNPLIPLPPTHPWGWKHPRWVKLAPLYIYIYTRFPLMSPMMSEKPGKPFHTHKQSLTLSASTQHYSTTSTFSYETSQAFGDNNQKGDPRYKSPALELWTDPDESMLKRTCPINRTHNQPCSLWCILCQS